MLITFIKKKKKKIRTKGIHIFKFMQTAILLAKKHIYNSSIALQKGVEVRKPALSTNYI